MKKLFYFLVVAIMVFNLSACGEKEPGKNADSKKTAQTSVNEETKAPESTSVTEEPALESSLSSEPTEAPEPDYEAIAHNVEVKLNLYFEAWRNGDIETILSMTKPEEELYEYLTLLMEYENTERLLQTVYSDIIFQDNCEGLVKTVKYSIMGGRSAFYVDNKVAMPYMSMLNDMIPGTLYQPGDVIEEGFCPKDEEEALDIISKLVEKLPLVAENIMISTPDSEGNFYVLEGERYFDFLIDELYTHQLDEEYLQTFVSEIFYPLEDKIVAADNGVYTDVFSEQWPKAIELIKQKDIDGMYEYYAELHEGSDLRAFESSLLFDENLELKLTDAQLAFLNDYVDKIEVFHYDIARVGSKEQIDIVYYICPALDTLDTQLREWYKENDIKEVTLVNCNSSPSNSIQTVTDLYFDIADDVKRIVKE